jgi:hypothetical protein
MADYYAMIARAISDWNPVRPESAAARFMSGHASR